MYSLSLEPLAVDDAVLLDAERYKWPFGVQYGYDKVPGKVVEVRGDVIDVKWADGHRTVHLFHDHEVCKCVRVERDKSLPPLHTADPFVNEGGK